ncbi:MAG TPA: hypothetical protein VLK25_13240 [Allosphingosinicella sp.]|nr:hypothetical protein [Allosphingosinicella sp.]
MTDEGVRNGDGYAHAGGFKSVLTLRTLMFALTVGGALLVGQIVIDRAYGSGASAALFRLFIASFMVFHGTRDILDTEKRKEAAGSAMSLRNIRIGGIVFLIAGTALGTSAIATLIEAWSGQ